MMGRKGRRKGKGEAGRMASREEMWEPEKRTVRNKKAAANALRVGYSRSDTRYHVTRSKEVEMELKARSGIGHGTGMRILRLVNFVKKEPSSRRPNSHVISDGIIHLSVRLPVRYSLCICLGASRSRIIPSSSLTCVSFLL